MEYTVVWTIQVDAETPREAAVEALKAQRDPGAECTVFEVFEEGQDISMGKSITIDLWERE